MLMLSAMRTLSSSLFNIIRRERRGERSKEGQRGEKEARKRRERERGEERGAA